MKRTAVIPTDPPLPRDPVPDTAQMRRMARRRSRWPWRPLAMLVVVIALFGAALAGLKAAIGRDFAAPDWLRQEVEARANARLGGPQISLGAASVRLGPDMTPRLMLRDVDLTGPEGQAPLSLSSVDVTLAFPALMRGRIELASLHLAGASLRLRRLADGSVDLSLGDAPTPLEQAASLTALIEGLDGLFAQPLLSVLTRAEVDALTLQYEDARLGRRWTVDGGRLVIERSDGALRLRADLAVLAGGDAVSTVAISYDSPIGTVAARFGVNFTDLPAGDIAVQSPALAWLSVLEAPISGAMRVAVAEDGTLGPLSATLQIGAGRIRPAGAAAPVPFDSARAYLTFDPEQQLVRFDDLSVTGRWLTARAEGVAWLQDVTAGVPQAFTGQFTLSEVQANPAGLYPAPVRIAGGTADLRLRLAPFDLELGQITLHDAGQSAQASGRVQVTPEGWRIGLSAALDSITMDRVLELWPDRAVPKTRGWLASNIRGARLHDIELAWRSRPGQRPDLYLGFGFDQGDIAVLPAFPHMTDVAGQASLFGDRFVVSTHSGQLLAPQGGAIDVAGTALIIPDVSVPQTPAQLRLVTASTITATLSVLNLPPFGFLDKAGQPVTLADGRAQARTDIALALVKDLQPANVQVRAKAQLTGVRSTVLVPGRVLAAPSLDLTLDSDSLTVAGQGRVGAVPFDGTFSSPLGPGGGVSTLTGTVTLGQAFADEVGIGLPPGSFSGTAPARIDMRFARGDAPTFRMTSSLAGLGMALPPLGWAKPRNASGTLLVEGALGAPARIDRISLEAPGLLATGALRLRADGQLDRATFSRVRAGTWLDAPVELVGRGARAAPAVRVTGGTVDLRRPMPAGNGGGEGGPLSLALDRLQITDSIALTRLRGEFGTARGLQGQFTAQVNDLAAVRGQVEPSGGRSAVRLQSDDAGAVLAAAGLLKKAREGSLDLTLVPGPAAGSYDGTLAVSRIWLREAPAMAALLNAVSIIGLLEQLGGSGILFNQVDARFRLTPERITLSKASATGASIGISMDGYYAVATSQLDMQGVFSPIYMLNGIGSILTRKGEGLIGFNYRLTGAADAPRVQVNPLSALTPGMFREIFRRPAPKLTE